MCWLPVDQPLIVSGDDSSVCGARRPWPCSVAQLLASRLRSVGDQLERSWTEKGCYRCGDREEEEEEKKKKKKSGNKYFQSFVRAAIQLTVLVLFVTRRRHL